MTFEAKLILLLLMIIGLLIKRYYKYAIFSHHSTDSTLHSPPSLPFLGNLIDIFVNFDRLHDYIYEYSKAYTTFTLSLPLGPIMYITNDVKDIQFVLKENFDNFLKGSHFRNIMEPVLGNGIFNIDGEEWFYQRKIASTIFNTKNFKDYVESTFKRKAKDLLHVLGEKAESGQVVDLQKFMFLYTLESFSEIAFGNDLKLIRSGETIPFAVAFDSSQQILLYRFFKPLFKFVEFFDGTKSKLNKDVAIIKEFAIEIIEKRRNELEKNQDSERNDLLSKLLQFSQENDRIFTTDDLIYQIVNFIIAGRDTTAQALSWTFYELMKEKHKPILNKLVAEFDAIPRDSDPDYEKLKSFKYAHNVFSEALRLHPSVPENMKQSISDTQLPSGLFVQKNARVVWSPYSMGRNVEIWGSDACEFRPERWDEKETKPSSFEFPVFNAGPRLCLGMNFAYLEGVYVLCQILRNFDLEGCDLDKVTYGVSLTLPMKNGLNVRLNKKSR